MLLTQTVRGDPMHAIDVMTSEVISVDENATVPAVARLLAERGISAVPVVDKDDQVIGMVSEGDLLHRAETGTAPIMVARHDGIDEYARRGLHQVT